MARSKGGYYGSNTGAEPQEKGGKGGKGGKGTPTDRSRRSVRIRTDKPKPY